MTCTLVAAAFWVGFFGVGLYLDGVERRLRAASRDVEERLRAAKGGAGR